MSAPLKASRWTSPKPSQRTLTGMSTAMAAPSAAPEAVPSTYGSASGLRSRPWNVVPATANAGADDGGRQHARQAQVDDDGLGRGRPAGGHRPAEVLRQDADRVADGHGDVAERDPGHDGHRQCRQCPESDRYRSTTQGAEPADPDIPGPAELGAVNHVRCIITASRRASATIAFFNPRRLAICIAQALSPDHFFECPSML